MKSKLTMNGFEDYLEKVAKAGADIDEVCGEALTVGGQILEAGMQRRAPELTGDLKSHIKMLPVVRDGNRSFTKVGVFDVNRETELYFFYQEWGTASTAAHPYIKPTFDEDWRRARAAMKQVFIDRGAL